MDDEKWERFAALGGALFVILNVVGAVAAGEPPSPGASAAKISTWFHDHHGAIAFSQACAGIAAAALVWWAGTLWRRLTVAEERPRLAVAAMVALAAAGALFLTANGVLAAMSIRIDDIGDDVLVPFYALSGVLLSGAGFFVAVHLACANALAMRARVWPMWLVVVGAVATVGFVTAGIIGSMSDSSAAIGVGLPSFVLWSVWILGVSVTMWRRAPATAPAMVATT